jgi:hypothetical protein
VRQNPQKGLTLTLTKQALNLESLGS